MRYFHDFYSIIQITDQVGITFGFDIGWEKKLNSNKWNNWFTPTLILRYTPDSNWAFAARAEYFNDEKEVIIYTGNMNGFNLFGASLNVDKLIHNNIWWRIEARTLNSKDAIFQKGNGSVRNDVSITTSFAISF